MGHSRIHPKQNLLSEAYRLQFTTSDFYNFKNYHIMHAGWLLKQLNLSVVVNQLKLPQARWHVHTL